MDYAVGLTQRIHNGQRAKPMEDLCEVTSTKKKLSTCALSFFPDLYFKVSFDVRDSHCNSTTVKELHAV